MGPKDTARGNRTMTAAAAEVEPHRRRSRTPARLCLGCKNENSAAKTLCHSIQSWLIQESIFLDNKILQTRV